MCVSTYIHTRIHMSRCTNKLTGVRLHARIISCIMYAPIYVVLPVPGWDGSLLPMELVADTDETVEREHSVHSDTRSSCYSS